MDLRAKFDKELDDVYRDIEQMTERVVKQLHDAIAVLQNRDVEAANAIIENDKEIDRMEMVIDDKCVRIIAMEQPVATDLRRLIALTKVTGDLERIGDVARHIARMSHKEIPENFLHHVPNIVSMCTKGISMLQRIIGQLKQSDGAAVRTIAQEDDEIDELHRQIRQDIIKDMKADPDHIKRGSVLLELSRMVERLGDYVTTICEWIIFSIDGTHIDLN